MCNLSVTWSVTCSQYISTCSERPQILQHHQASGSMKTKELSKQVRGKVVEEYRSRLGYKKISETLNIPRRTIKSIIKKLKEYDTTTNLPREGRPPKLMDQARRALIRGNRDQRLPRRSCKDPQRRSVYGTTLRCTLHRAGLYRRVARKKAIA